MQEYEMSQPYNENEPVPHQYVYNRFLQSCDVCWQKRSHPAHDTWEAEQPETQRKATTKALQETVDSLDSVIRDLSKDAELRGYSVEALRDTAGNPLLSPLLIAKTNALLAISRLL